VRVVDASVYHKLLAAARCGIGFREFCRRERYQPHCVRMVLDKGAWQYYRSVYSAARYRLRRRRVGEVLALEVISGVSSLSDLLRHCRSERGRSAERVLLRRALVGVLVRMCGLPMAVVGRLMGYDHTTIMHHCDIHDELVRLGDSEYLCVVRRLEELCRRASVCYERHHGGGCVPSSVVVIDGIRYNVTR